MNRVNHSINGVNFVPVNVEDFTLKAQFPDGIGEWKNTFTAENRVVLPQEAYIELLRHLNDTGVQQMPRYNIGVNGKNNEFYVDMHGGVSIAGSVAEVSIKNFVSKDNMKANIDALTFEYLHSIGKITTADMVNIPYVVVPDDIGSKILNISLMVFVLTKEIIDTSVRLTTRIGDLIAGTVPSVGVGVVYPTGALIRFGILITMDIATLVILTIALRNLIKQAFELLLPPVRNYKAMTVDKLLTIALSEFGMNYSSTIKSEFRNATILPVPIDFKKKKFFQMLLNEDDRILNRGYPTSSDTIPTAGLLIDEISKIYNIIPTINGNTLVLNPKGISSNLPKAIIDHNFNDQDKKENVFELDLSRIWNTKIISYQNDSSDKLLFDNPRGLRVEYKTLPINQSVNELTIIKGFQEIRINFALGTIKEETKLDEFLSKLAKVADKLLNTSFTAKMNLRKGVMAVSQEQFSVTKFLYQRNGKQTADYVKKIGAGYIGDTYHAVDHSKNSLYNVYSGMPVRLENNEFLKVVQNNSVILEGVEVDVSDIEYSPESSRALISYRTKNLTWAKNMTTIKVYEE